MGLSPVYQRDYTQIKVYIIKMGHYAVDLIVSCSVKWAKEEDSGEYVCHQGMRAGAFNCVQLKWGSGRWRGERVRGRRLKRIINSSSMQIIITIIMIWYLSDLLSPQ